MLVFMYKLNMGVGNTKYLNTVMHGEKSQETFLKFGITWEFYELHTG